MTTNTNLKKNGVSYDLFETKKLTHPTWLEKKTVWDLKILSLNPPTNHIGQVHTLSSNHSRGTQTSTLTQKRHFIKSLRSPKIPVRPRKFLRARTKNLS